MTVFSTLTRYISIRFFFAICAVFALCLLLIFMIDFVELLRRSGKFGETSIAMLAWITLLRLPSFAELTLPFAVLAGSIGAFLLLSRSSELIIIRASGMSVWQFALPGVAVAFLVGLMAIMLYNPLAAYAKAESERIYADVFGRNTSLLRTRNSGSWLRQDSVDGQSIIHAYASSDQGTKLTSVTIFQFDQKKRFLERVEAGHATLKDGHWLLEKATVSKVGQAPVDYDTYLVSTHLTLTQVRDALGSVNTISFWQLPGFIDFSEKAGLSATRYKVQYQLLMSRPLLLAVMVLLAATCSLRAFRFGNIQRMVILGLIAGIGFFLFAEVSRNIGLSGLTTPIVSAWVPVFVALCLALTVLLHQEDG